MTGMDTVVLILVVVVVGIAAAVALDRLRAVVRSRQRWVGTPMSYAVQLVGRMPDGSVEDSIEGVPVQVNLHLKELLQFLRDVLFETILEMAPTSKANPPEPLAPKNPTVMPDTSIARKKRAEFAKKILPVFKSPMPMVPYAFGSNRLVIQFNRVAPLDHYALGPAIEPYRSVAEGGSMSKLIVSGELHPYPQKIRIPGGLREAVMGKIPIVKGRSERSEDVELFFFEPYDLSKERIQPVQLSETVRSHFALLAERAAEFASVHGLYHRLKLKDDQIRSLNDREKQSRNTIKDLHDEISRLLKMMPRIRVRPTSDILLRLTMTYLVMLFLSMAIMGLITFLVGPTMPIVGEFTVKAPMKVYDSGLVAFFLGVGVMIGVGSGFLLNYLRMAREQ